MGLFGMICHRRRLRCWLVAFGGSLGCWRVFAADPLPQQAAHPFRTLAAWLREASPDMRSAEPRAISRGITVLSNSQGYVKSFDGLAYEIKGKIKEGASTADIDKLREEAALYESASSAKQANKLVKLLVEVERALNSAEAAEIASQSDPARAVRFTKEAGLQLLPKPPPPPPPAAPDDKSSSASATPAYGAEGSSQGIAAAGNAAARTAFTAKPKPATRSRAKSPGSNSKSGKVGATGEENAAGKRRPFPSSSSSSSAAGSLQNEGVKKKKGKQGAKVKEGGRGESGKPAAAATGKPVEAFVVTVGGCEVRCLLMLDERGDGGGGEEAEGRGRLVVAVGDSLTGEALLRSLIEEPAMVQLASHGLMRETAYVNRAAFQSACDILEWAGPLIKASVGPGGAFEGYRVHCTGHSFGGAVAACLAGLLDGAIDVDAPSATATAAGDNEGGSGSGSGSCSGGGGGGLRRMGSKRGAPEKASGRQKPRNGTSARKRGEAFRDRRKRENGGGDSGERSSNGSPPSSYHSSEESDESDDGDRDRERGGAAVRVEGAAPWVAACRGRVTCVTLGCPPCLSQNLRLPFVTSFVVGDDMVPRTTHESLRRLKRRLLQVMPKGKGLVSQGMAFSTSLFTDVAGVAMQGVRQATTLGEDDARLAVPGKVWFAKPRRLKNGATLSRVMQGNLKEDMLWQLHDIMLTKSMLSHHCLDKYVRVLDRV